MSKNDELTLDQSRLVNAWIQTLPTVIGTSDRCEVYPDTTDPKSLRITFATARDHTTYSFDYKCTYLDAREVQVELIDVERNKASIDERTEAIQSMIEGYIRDIHECAQQLHSLTSS